MNTEINNSNITRDPNSGAVLIQNDKSAVIASRNARKQIIETQERLQLIEERLDKIEQYIHGS